MSQIEHTPQEYEYTITTDNEDPRKAIISKKGPYEVEFSIEDVEKNQNELSKMKREAQGKLEIESSVMKNVEHFHPFVLSISDEQLHTAWMYNRAKRAVRAATETIEECEKELARVLEEKEYIMNKLGLTPKPDVVVEEHKPGDPTPEGDLSVDEKI